MEERFDWMTFGDDVSGAQAGSAAPPSTGADEDVPIFLREDVGMVRAGASHATAASESTGVDSENGAPAFLAVCPGADVAPRLSGGWSSEGSPVWDGSLRQQQKPSSTAALGHPGGAGDVQAAPSAALYADQPSAAVLHFTGDSGRSWGALHRVRILGKGSYGCATLYSMKDAASGGVEPTHAVVVKDINMQTMLNPAEEVLAVQNELKVLRTVLGHPNLVQYVDALFDTRPPTYPMSFIMMEYCAGGDLAAVMDGRRSDSATTNGAPSSPPSIPLAITTASTAAGPDILTEPCVASLFIQVAVALQSLHTEYGILHRDVKPHNIFLLEDGITVRLGDFGISTQLDRVGDTAKEACGSPYYMAPELFEERAYGAAADVWSLGVVFYQLIARQLPFTAASAAELRSLVCRGRCTPLQDLQNEAASRYSRQFKELVSSLLTVDAAARPTLRRVLRHKYVRESLKYVPASVLTAKKPLPPARVPSAGAMPSSSLQRFSADGLYAGLFGSDVVEQAVSQAVHAGVYPIVSRVHSA
ncbi:protein kinase, putative [Leishmania donovani]|uniref:non-specific serine/threonine protein kinase n=1 Tax=Leishmania donovani TaxID=5661 RepID=A0A3S5H4Z4_LEIDO|nr:protein kinase, putative [Leishmania donovani]AYU75630.1 NIMA/Nek Serine/threonine-protein kinase family, putative [Leishmania donovani]TPP43090.1 Protein kinase domain family protein [Leishmania donovani]CBZ31196.1 protein kinase, putative [Leishmania donovani]